MKRYLDELSLIIQSQNWPGVERLQDWKAQFPQWKGGIEILGQIIGDKLDADGLDLLYVSCLSFTLVSISNQL